MKRKDAKYFQCALQKGNTHHMAWIPEQFANVGRFIKIKKDDDTWEDGWEVTGKSDVIKSASDANDLSQRHKILKSI